MLVSSSPGPDCIVRGIHNNQDALVLEYKVKCKSNVSNKFNLVSTVINKNAFTVSLVELM